MKLFEAARKGIALIRSTALCQQPWYAIWACATARHPKTSSSSAVDCFILYSCPATVTHHSLTACCFKLTSSRSAGMLTLESYALTGACYVSGPVQLVSATWHVLRCYSPGSCLVTQLEAAWSPSAGTFLSKCQACCACSACCVRTQV